ncbi:MAG: DUF362 domain-containing protein [Planctomycetota bacterium]
MPPRATVAIEITTSYHSSAIGKAISKIVESAGGWAGLIRSGDRVLVKPNCISAATPDQAVQTHPAVILEICRQLLDFGARPFVGDSPAWGTLQGNLRQLGIIDDLSRLAVPVVPFKNPVKAENPKGKVFHKLTVDSAALDADAIVNVPKFKAHRQVFLTVAIKNMFGCVNGRRKAWWHVKAGSYDNYFGRMLVETYVLLQPVINIVDAVVAMEGNGPIKGQPRPMNLIIGSTDGVAIERIAADLVDVKPARIRTLQAAKELAVGIPYRDQIDIRGPDIADIRVKDFQLPKLLPLGFSIPRLVKGTLKNAWIVHQQTKTKEA